MLAPELAMTVPGNDVHCVHWGMSQAVQDGARCRAVRGQGEHERPHRCPPATAAARSCSGRSSHRPCPAHPYGFRLNDRVMVGKGSGSRWTRRLLARTGASSRTARHGSERARARARTSRAGEARSGQAASVRPRLPLGSASMHFTLSPATCAARAHPRLPPPDSGRWVLTCVNIWSRLLCNTTSLSVFCTCSPGAATVQLSQERHGGPAQQGLPSPASCLPAVTPPCTR